MTTLSDVSKNLDAIQDMAARLEARAIDRANDKLMPGGDAMVLLASVGSRHDWERRNELAEQAGDYSKADTEDPDNFWLALQALWFWSETYRQRLGMDYDDPRWRPSLVSEANFLRNRDVAEWIWNHEPRWDHYATAVADAKTKLENVLVEGDRSERSRVVCGNPNCEDPRTLIRVYAKRHPTEWTCEACGSDATDPDACSDCGCQVLTETVWESNPDDDRWKCGSCKGQYDDEQVRDFYGKQLWLAPAEKWMPVSHAVQLMKDQGWQERVVRGWLNDPDGAAVEIACEETSGRRIVLWPTLWRRHLLETQARKERVKRREERSA